MKKLTLIFLLISFNFSFSQNYYRFTEGQEVYLYGDNVRLRELPSTNSEVIKLLPVGTKVKIKRVTDRYFKYNGISSPWYLVQYNSIEGFIVGGLISLGIQRSYYNPDAFYVYNISKGKSYDSNKTYLNIRFVYSHQIYSDIKIQLVGNRGFDLLVTDNRGLKNATDIIIVNNYSKSCGVDRGKSYFVNTGNKIVPLWEILLR